MCMWTWIDHFSAIQFSSPKHIRIFFFLFFLDMKHCCRRVDGFCVCARACVCLCVWTCVRAYVLAFQIYFIDIYYYIGWHSETVCITMCPTTNRYFCINKVNGTINRHTTKNNNNGFFFKIRIGLCSGKWMRWIKTQKHTRNNEKYIFKKDKGKRRNDTLQINFGNWSFHISIWTYKCETWYIYRIQMGQTMQNKRRNQTEHKNRIAPEIIGWRAMHACCSIKQPYNTNAMSNFPLQPTHKSVNGI